MNAPIPQLVQARTVERSGQSRLLDEVIARTGQTGFDPDAWHVMDRRDDALIADEVVNGAQSGRFVYEFEIKGTKVSGVSVVGARHLAYEYGGIKSFLVSSVQKIGSLWLFRSYPHSGRFDIRPEHFRELDDEPDFYEVLMEIQDVKTGNSVQVEKREQHFESRRDGSSFERPHYITIAQAKAFRNGILNLLPQDVILKFKAKNLPLAAKRIDIGEDVLAEKRAGVLRYAAAQGVPIDRGVVESLTLDQIAGLSDAAHTKSLPAFAQAAKALGLIAEANGHAEAEQKAPEKPRRGRPPATRTAQPTPQQEPPHDPETGEIAKDWTIPPSDEPPPAGEELAFG